jgi:hypothetical protein
MKSVFILTITLLTLFTFGCQKEVLTTDNQDRLVMGSVEGHFRPAQQCGTSAFTNLVNGGTSYGSLEILNDGENLYILTDMNDEWLLTNVKIFADNSVNLPKGSNGLIQMEEFPFQMVHANMVDEFTYTLPISGLPSCMGITVWAQASQVDMFGSVINQVNLWADGAAVLDGFSYQYCKGSCGSSSALPQASTL